MNLCQWGIHRWEYVRRMGGGYSDVCLYRCCRCGETKLEAYL